MEWAEAFGYLGAALALITVSMKTMLPLRLAAIGSSLAFLAYGIVDHLLPVIVLHALMLPVNAGRLVQVVRLRQATARATKGEMSIEPLLPFMLQVQRKQGSVLFEKNDPADILYYLAEGAVRIVEVNKLRAARSFIGEIALFAPNGRRTATVVCETDCTLFAITARKVKELYFENPEFGLYVVHLITGRLIENMSGSSAEPAAASS
jgi:energy-converting hydrogenase Eha subunit E